MEQRGTDDDCFPVQCSSSNGSMLSHSTSMLGRMRLMSFSRHASGHVSTRDTSAVFLRITVTEQCIDFAWHHIVLVVHVFVRDALKTECVSRKLERKVTTSSPCSTPGRASPRSVTFAMLSSEKVSIPFRQNGTPRTFGIPKSC